MSSREVEAAGHALEAYSAMASGFLGDVNYQPAAEAVLDDLRTQTAHGVAGLQLVRQFVDVLPSAAAPRPHKYHLDYVHLENPADLPRTLGTMVWGPVMEDGRAVSPMSTPYYIVGHRPTDHNQPQGAELLLASAAHEQDKSAGLVIAKTWMAEVAAVDATMAHLLTQSVTPEQVRRHYNPQSGNLTVPAPDNTHRWDFGPVRVGGQASSTKYRNRDAERAHERIFTTATTVVERTEWLKADNYRIGHKGGLSFEDRVRYSVVPRLIHLAVVHGKQNELKELLQTLPDAEQPGPLAQFIAEAR